MRQVGPLAPSQEGNTYTHKSIVFGGVFSTSFCLTEIVWGKAHHHHQANHILVSYHWFVWLQFECVDRASEIRMPPEGTSDDGFSQLPFLGADARECVWYRRQRIYLRASGINCGSGDSICFWSLTGLLFSYWFKNLKALDTYEV